jgi:hypothetical protein
MINELIAQLIAQIEQTIRDWWDSLIEDIKQQMVDWWEGIKRDLAQAWQDIWSYVRPPPPIITAPADGIMSLNGTISVRGTGLPEGIITLRRNGKYYRDVTANAAGEWQMDAVVLVKGENAFTAIAAKRIWSLDSPRSNTVNVTFPGGELGIVPSMSPAIDSTLDPHTWMVELALDQIKAGGETFYEEQRSAFAAANSANNVPMSRLGRRSLLACIVGPASALALDFAGNAVDRSALCQPHCPLALGAEPWLSGRGRVSAPTAERR